MDLVERELQGYAWSHLPVMGDRSDRVPKSLAGLVQASSEKEAEKYYWELENSVVVQGQLFEAAPPVTSVLLASLAGTTSVPAREWIIELLFQLVSGESDEEAVARGNASLGEECRRRAREGLWLLYREAVGKFYAGIKDVIAVVETDQDRFLRLL